MPSFNFDFVFGDGAAAPSEPSPRQPRVGKPKATAIWGSPSKKFNRGSVSKRTPEPAPIAHEATPPSKTAKTDPDAGEDEDAGCQGEPEKVAGRGTTTPAKKSGESVASFLLTAGNLYLDCKTCADAARGAQGFDHASCARLNWSRHVSTRTRASRPNQWRR